MSHIRGRFSKPADKLAAQYTASLPFDRRLYKQDIAGSIAHAKMLARQGIISDEDAKTIIDGLEVHPRGNRAGQIRVQAGDWKISTWPSSPALSRKWGRWGVSCIPPAPATTRWRWTCVSSPRKRLPIPSSGLRDFQRALLDLAEANKDVIIPGYTHLQVAQPVLLAHHLLAYFEMLERDIARFNDCLKRVDVLPLGSGALAGVAYDIDREFLAKELGFSQVSQNSLDAVSDRDFVLEYEAAASICMMHLSRLAEEIVLWSSAEFGFIELDDAYTTGSSIMPQKKNPDVAELARGKTGRVYGHLMALLTTMKGLPLAYNRDMQEDKQGFFDTVDTLLSTLEVFTGMVGTLKVNAENTRKAAERGYILATDLADYLVKKGRGFPHGP